MSNPAPAKLPDSEIAVAWSALPGWQSKSGKLHREYKVTDFVDAFALAHAMEALSSRLLGK